MLGVGAARDGEILHRSDPRIVRLTTEILALQETAERDYAETTVEVGRKLREVVALLVHGDWIDWLEEEVPFTRRSASNYMRLSEWAEDHAADFARFKQLGPTKLYAIMTLDWRGMRVLRSKKAHVLEDGAPPLALERMSVPQLYRLVEKLGGGGSTDAEIEYVLRGYRQRVTRLQSATERLIARRRELGSTELERVAELHSTLVEAAGSLERAFDLAPRSGVAARRKSRKK
jgi:hypothetical protein